MAAALHGQLGKLTKAIPIEAIARALDITEVRKEEMDGCEGVLLTDRMRSYGKILVNTGTWVKMMLRSSASNDEPPPIASSLHRSSR